MSITKQMLLSFCLACFITAGASSIAKADDTLPLSAYKIHLSDNDSVNVSLACGESKQTQYYDMSITTTVVACDKSSNIVVVNVTLPSAVLDSTYIELGVTESPQSLDTFSDIARLKVNAKKDLVSNSKDVFAKITRLN